MEGCIMKLLKQYKILKEKYSQNIILLKSGTFYVAYENDAYILNYLLQYQINDSKIGFPKSATDKVLEVLKENNINFLFEDVKIEYDNNNYDKILYLAKKKYYQELNEKILLEQISFLIKNNPENLSKIRSFIDEF